MNNINTTHNNFSQRTETVKSLFNRFYYAMRDNQKKDLLIRLEGIQTDILEELSYVDEEKEANELKNTLQILDKYHSLMKKS